MAKDPAYPMYAQDFDMDTAAWTVAQIGAYIRLLNYSWVNGRLPNNIAALARIARVDPRNMQKMWSTAIAKKWKTDDANMLFNSRMEKEREARSKYIETQKEKGIKGAEKRWNKDMATAMPVPQPENGSSSSSSLKEKELKQRANPVPKSVDNSPPPDPPEKKQLYELFLKISKEFPDPSQLREVQLFIELNRRNGNPKALVYSLNRLLEEKEKGKPPVIIGKWLEKVMLEENKNHNARDAEAETAAYKRDFTKIEDIFRGMPR